MPETMPETKSRTTNSTFRAACITWFSTDVPMDIWDDRIQYIAYGKEICPTTGKQHLQMWAYCKTPQRFTAWKKLFPGCHIERMRGTFANNDDYCSKESDLVCIGEKPMGNGERRCDLLVKDAIDADPTKPLAQIYEETENIAAIRYDRAFEKYRLYKRCKTIPINEPVEVIFIYGLPGSGKTRYVFDTEPDVYEVPFGMHWFDGYEGQEAVLFDNLRPDDIKDKGFFLRLIDRYRVQVPIKGGFTYWKPKRVYITTVNAQDRFANLFDDVNEFYRRITVFKDM